ncbi:gamma-glutamyltransferase family protein [Fodinibius sp.]|uniref:gamma-glutamyltransferase family protein n=1 Tax=Fodinibius sp. TaxID=1872440 RepID=UPI00356587E4
MFSHKLQKKIFSGSLLLCSIFILVGCSTSQSQVDLSPTYQSDQGKKLIGEEAMVSSAHPLASQAGLTMLKKGGNAVDAAVATAFALNVVEPNMSGIGGGGSMLIWDQENNQTDYADFYTAKRAETYRDLDYSQFEEGAFNLLSTGVPGTVDGLLQALERHGTMSREEVMAPAIRYAREGFPVYLTLAQFIEDNEEKLSRYEGARKTFWPGGEPLAVGEILKQPELAQTLQNISDEGASAFYEGENARDMVELLNEAGNPVTPEDFAEYEPQWDKVPLCGSYDGYTVLSAPLPQTGFYIIQALNILENYDLARRGLPTVSAEAFDIVSSTMRLSIADRSEYGTDPNWEDIPVTGLISKAYAEMRREQVGQGTVPDEIEPGDPSDYTLRNTLPQCSEAGVGRSAGLEKPNDPKNKRSAASYAHAADSFDNFEQAEEGAGETTHISVVDPAGNAVSFSTTLSHVFGSGAWVNGFLLNNSGFNFSSLEEEEAWDSSHPYRIRASTISPTIILEDGEVRLVIGAPGGGRIPSAILQNIVYILEYGLDPLDAVRMPRIFPGSSNPEVQIEKGFDHDVLAEVRNMGYDVQALSSGYARLYLVSVEGGKIIGVSDPRHDGEPRGF